MKLLNFTHRLPGPLACYFLQEHGWQITHVNLDQHLDPFEFHFEQIDSTFKSWYKSFKKNQKVVNLKLSFKKNERILLKLIQEADVVLWNHTIEKKIAYLLESEVNPKLKNLIADTQFFSIIASRKAKHLHDCNLLAASGILSLPRSPELSVLPWLGIIFAQKIALNLSQILIKKKSMQNFHQINFEKELDFLKNIFVKSLKQKSNVLIWGAFPCYHIYYHSKNFYLVIGAIELGNWKKFILILDHPKLGDSDQFKSSKTTIKKIEERIREIPLIKWKDLLKNANYSFINVFENKPTHLAQ